MGFSLPLQAQTATTGALSGLVTGTDGVALEGVEVALIRVGEEEERVISASRDGRFRAGFLPPGGYLVVVERFGFVPVRVSGVPIRSGSEAVLQIQLLQIQLREAAPPVTETDRFTFTQVGSERSRGAGALTRDEVLGIPTAGVGLTDVLDRWSRVAPWSPAGPVVAGLPGHLLSVSVDGLPFEPVSHPRLGPGLFHLGSLSPLFMADLELVGQDVDVEGGGGSGARLRGSSLRGGNQLEMEVRTGLGAGPLGAEDRQGGTPPSTTLPTGSVLIRGAVVPDTLQFAAGVHVREAARLRTPLAASGAEARDLFLDRVGDPERPDERRIGPTRVDTWRAVSGFGRLDWRFGGSNTLTLRTHVGAIRDGASEGRPLPSLVPQEGVEVTDLILAAAYVAQTGERSAVEFRAGYEASERVFGGQESSLELEDRVWIHEGGIVAGSDPAIPGRFRQTAFRVQPLIHFSAGQGRHHFKVGGEFAARQVEEDRAVDGRPLAGYASVAAFSRGEGIRLRTEGPRRSVSFSRPMMGLFFQDRWSVTEDVTVTAGLRGDWESLPLDDILPNEAWTTLTGIPRDRPDSDLQGRVSPRIEVEWSPGAGPGWRVHGAAGITHGQVHPGLVAELLADSGAVQVTRSLEGEAATEVFDTDDASARGRTFAILGPRFNAPRTQALELEVSRALGIGTWLGASVGLRRTDFLPRRRDLNRTPAPFARDQFGRELFGEIVQSGETVAIRPHSDRWFQEFDAVWALESDGHATWLGTTLSLGHDGGGPLRFHASYTFSETRDNLPAGLSGWPEAVAGRPGALGRSAESDWTEGRSDWDVPHRLAAWGSVQVLESPGLRVGVGYGLQSGLPFTPTVRDFLTPENPLGPGALAGVSTRPLDIPTNVTGLDAVASRWACVGPGAAAERNTCRTDPIHDLSLRVEAQLLGGAGWALSVQADALNLLDQGPVLPDPALFIVDGDGPLGDPVNGRLDLPVRVNPNFGEPLVRLSPGRLMRIGLELRY